MPLALLALLAPAAPARAGHWELTTAGSGSASVGGSGQNFTPPSPTQNSVTLPDLGAGAGNTVPLQGTASLKVTVTGTWTPDGNSDDTPPPGVWLVEGSEAAATDSADTATGANGPTQAGTANDGWGDPVGQSGASPGVSAPSPDPKYVQASGGTFTVPLTLKASASATPVPYWSGGSPGRGQYNPGFCSASVSVGPITVAVHAQPYDFHKTSGIDEGNGTLLFTYGWSSSDGNISDLTSCFMHERVTYPGGNPYTVPLPFSWPNPLPNPTISPGQGRSGIAMVSITDNEDHQYVWTPVAPYSDSTITAQQQYEYDDIATGVYNTVIPGPDATASIVRTIGLRQLQLGLWYSCTKQGVTAWLQLQ